MIIFYTFVPFQKHYMLLDGNLYFKSIDRIVPKWIRSVYFSVDQLKGRDGDLKELIRFEP